RVCVEPGRGCASSAAGGPPGGRQVFGVEPGWEEAGIWRRQRARGDVGVGHPARRARECVDGWGGGGIGGGRGRGVGGGGGGRGGGGERGRRWRAAVVGCGARGVRAGAPGAPGNGAIAEAKRGWEEAGELWRRWGDHDLGGAERRAPSNAAARPALRAYG